MDIMIYMTVFDSYSNNPGTGKFFFLEFLKLFLPLSFLFDFLQGNHFDGLTLEVWSQYNGDTKE